MHRQRSIFDIFPENVDLNQGPNFNGNNIESDECNSRLSPTERRLLSNDHSGELNFSFVNSGHHHSSRFSSWDVGESSSRANLQDQAANDGLKLDNNWPNSQLRDGFGGSQGGPSNLQSSDYDPMPMDVDLNVDYGANSGNPETEASSSGTSEDSGTDFSFGHWGSSNKRIVLDGSSGEIFGSGSSSFFPEAENTAWHTLNRNNGSSNFSPSLTNSQTPMNTIAGVGFPPNISGVAESSRRSYGMRDSGNPGSYSNGNSSGLPARRPGEYLNQTSRGPISTNAGSLSLQLPSVHSPGTPRNTHPFQWSGSSSSSLPRESSSHLPRVFIPIVEARTSVQDPNNWSLGMGRASTNGGGPSSSSRNNVGSAPGSGSGSGSGSRHSNALWTPRLNPATQNQQRLSEFSPWTLFPSSEADSGGHRGHFSPFPAGSSSTSEEHLPRTFQPVIRSTASVVEAPGDEWQAFTADIEGRHRLVAEMRQILSALRRGENLRAEDMMLFDPYSDEIANLHDRHRDMRLDVDNMSYEELLALEERIGDVKTGLSEEAILKSMKQRKHVLIMGVPTRASEPCCICREEYENGDAIGSLDCGHDFHTCCIKQWLAQKNLCPICKMTGLST